MFLKLFKTIATLLVLISISAVTQARSLDEILKSGVLKGGVNPGYHHLLNMMIKII